ncbi:MAG TPA: S46 family peptidase [Kofleriaceae bacterium]|nr:S46 family peptidase [Kofleriaceae bacterium]
MDRRLITCSLVVAACSGGGSKGNVTGGALGTSHDTSGLTSAPDGSPAKPDAHLAARKEFTNPGGMWLPQQLTLPAHVENFKKLGVQIDNAALADPLAAPLGAIVAINGCTSSFVSPEGLLVTNHHCVQGALQINSNEKANLVETGYLAKTRADEKSAGAAARVYVLQGFRDITKDIRDGLEKIKDPNARKDEVDKRSKKLLADCEKNRPWMHCDVARYFRGAQYSMLEYLEIRDVRLVYAPPRSIGNYGGEIDNWAWPRHTGDFSFYRAYVGKDGKPADYSTDNVPYRPKQVLKLASAPLRASDFVMVVGYPGSTSRTSTASEVRHDVEWRLPYQIANLKESYAMLDSHTKDGGETGIKAGVAKQGVQNYLEKYEGMLKGLTKGELLSRKEALDKQVKEWAAKPEHEMHKAAIARLEQLIAEAQRTARVDYDREKAFSGSRLMGTALSLTRWAEERAKKDPDRKPGYQDRDLRRALAAQKQLARQYDRTLDRAGFRLALVRALQLPEAERPWLATLLDVKKGTKIDEALIDKTLDGWYAAQQLEDEKLRLELLGKGTTAQIKASKDPFLKAAQRIWPIVKAEEKKADARRGELLLVEPYYADAMREVLGGMLPPDANGTLRITYGTVKSFKPASKDPADLPFTLAHQLLSKNTGKEPFDAPKAELELIKAKKFSTYADTALGDLPVDFLSDLDITNGNSGSPTLNSKGELVGLAFDGTLEGVASDVVFDGATTRTIHCDARYMLWVMDALDQADHLLREMGVEPRL